MYTIEISEDATLDVLEALEWYKRQDRKLSLRLKAEIDHGFQFIKKTPFSFQLKYKDVRVYYCKTFPYGIHYVIENEIIKVIAVFHTSRHPKNWQEIDS